MPRYANTGAFQIDTIKDYDIRSQQIQYITVLYKMHLFLRKDWFFMPAYYDEKTKTWFCKFYYTDYTGAKKQKKKRGFKLQREAKEWERTFLERLQGTPDMTFQALYDLYIEDMSHRLRRTA